LTLGNRDLKLCRLKFAVNHLNPRMGPHVDNAAWIWLF